MRLDVMQHAPILLLACGLAAPAAAGSDTPALEALLRAREPVVTRWQVQPLSEEIADADFARAQLGRIAARTPVRFADGRVRWYAVAGYRDVLVSARPLQGGDAVDAGDTRLESRDVLALGCEPMTTLDATSRWRARRRLAAGEVLCASTLEPAPDVERNRAVTLSARSGGIEVSRVLTASSDARLGERVRLRDRDGANLVGIVTGPGAARIAGENP
jgi:flagella basal body P-ring formation protein FlgA